MTKTKKQKNKKANNRNGYFLINLIVTIGVMGVIAGISAPTLRAYLPGLRLRGEARALAGQLREAQQRTVTEQVVHYVFIDEANNRYQLFRDDNPDTLITTTVLDSGVTISEVNDLTDDTVIFNSYGAVVEPGNIVLQNELNALRTVIIKPSGYVQLD